MLQTQKKQIEFLNKLLEYVEELPKDKEDILSLINEIKNTELLIPIIGGFSSGKSTLLNSFLTKEYLPVGITPETDLATEIRYSDEEYILAMKNNEEFDKYQITQWDKIKENASKYKFIKLFVNQESVKKIEPLILVDMPGFEAPNKLHNQAIMDYIVKGVYFVVLINSMDGTIKNSILKELKNIKELGRDFSIMLSKTNQLLPSKVEEVLKNVITLAEIELEYNKDILTLRDSSQEELNKVIENINPEELFDKLYLPLLEDKYFDITENFSYLISTLSENSEENQKEIQEIQKSIKELEEEKNRLIKEAEAEYTDSKIEAILIDIKNEIFSQKLQLIETFITSPKSFEKEFEAVVKYAVTRHIRYGIEDISLDILDKFTNNINLNTSINPEIISQITDSIKFQLNNLSQNMNKFFQKKGEMTDSLRSVFAVLAIITNVLAPVIEVLILFIPELIGEFLEKFQKNKIRNELNIKFDNEIVPRVIDELKRELPRVFKSQVLEIIRNISEEFESKLKEKESLLEKIINEKESQIIQINQQIEKYEKYIKNIKQLANEYIYKRREND